jgi:hypothetical protein
VLTLASCGSTNATPTSPSGSTPPAASVTDPVGDTVVLPVLRNGVLLTPFVAVPPDLVAATVTANAGSVSATVSFAPGTLSRTDTFACVMLDVDENAATGSPSAGGDVRLGYDYSVCAVVPRGSATAQVSRLDAVGAVGIGSASVTFVSNDQLRVAVPLSLLGNDDGRVAFKVASMQWVDEPIFNTGAIDWMPDLGRAAGLVR